MFIFLILFPLISWSFPVLHFIKPESNFAQITTLDACTTYLTSFDMVGCNPALFPLQSDEGVRMGLATITDGESVDVGQKLLFDPIKKDFLEKLFEKRAFNSWGGNSHIEFRTSKFYLAYNPIAVNADVFVFNPSSPEIALSLIKSNRLQVSSGFKMIENDSLTASLGGKFFYFRNEYYQDSFFLTDLTSQDIDKIIKFKQDNGVAADIGAFFKFNNAWLPKVSFLAKNLNSPMRVKEKDIVAENQMRPLLLYETYTRLGVGYDFKMDWGALSSEVNLPFKDLYSDLYSEYISGSVGYSLSRFHTYLSYAKYQQVFGFNFGSKIANIGIFYGRSQPLGDFSTQKENVGGVKAEVSL